MTSLLFNNSNCFNVSHITVANNRTEILDWLSPLDPRIRHQGIRTQRVDDVGEWLLQTNEFRGWCDSGEGGSGNATLFCYGGPGVGKTYISSLAIDRLCDRAGEQKLALVCFYIDFAARGELSPTNILGSLLRQLVSGLDDIPEEVADAFQAQRRAIGGRALRLAEIVKLLQTITSSQRTIMCVDALDECAPEHRLELLDSLRQIIRVSPGTRLFLTGRPHIRGEIEKKLAGTVTTVPISPRKYDIVTFIRSRLDKDTNPDAMNDSLAADIIKRIPEAASEIFLLISLNTEAVLRETTIHRRRQRLGAITDGLGLGDMYGTTLERIKAQDGERSRLGMAALMWICHAERPLQVDELCHALAVEIGSTSLNAENVPSVGTLLDCCQGLFIVDQGASIVRLVHFTLQEYLCTRHDDLFNRAHSEIAETCLTYLNSQQVKNLSTNPSAGPQDVPLIRYSSRYWGTHAKIELSNRARSLALELFSQCDGHIPAKLLLRQVWSWGLVEYDSSFSFTGLHYVSFFGISELAVALLEIEGYDINQRDCVGLTPLIWAAMYGHSDVVKLLLGQGGIHPGNPDNKGRTPLLWAARNGHDEVVGLLLGREGVNPNNTDSNGRTPLSWAARNGHGGAVKLLLNQGDVDPNKPGNNSQTPLLWASRNGHEGVVKLLVERGDVDPDRPDEYNQTPLSWAAENGHEGIVKLLLGWEGVNPNKPDSNGQTPLSWAARNGHEGVAKLLLERGDVDPNEPDDNNQSPLLGAARYGHEGVVRLLLGRRDVDPNRQDETLGRTALSWAAGNGHGGVVKLLLGREGIDHNGRDKRFGRTALSWATGNGHWAVVKLLPAEPSGQCGPLFLPSSPEDRKFSYGQETTQPQMESSLYDLHSNNETNGDFSFEFEQAGTLPDNLYSDHEKDENSCFRHCASDSGSLELGQNRPFHTCGLFDSPEYSSCHNTVGSSRAWSISDSRKSGADSYDFSPSLALHGSPPNPSHQDPCACIPQGHTLAQPSPAPSTSLSYEGPSLTQPTGSPVIHNGYLPPLRNYSSAVIHNGSLPAYRSARRRTTKASHSSQNLHLCHCGKRFGRWTDLVRHQKTSSGHGGLARLVCPVPGCALRETRVDDLIDHYRRRHSKSKEETDRFSQDLRSRRTIRP